MMLKKMLGALVMLCASLFATLPVHAADYHYSADYTIGELLKNAEAAAVLEKFLPGLQKSPQLAMAKNMTLAQVAEYPQSGISEEKLAAMSAELAKIKADAPPAD